MNKQSPVLKGFVLLMYFLLALTGQNNRYSGMKDIWSITGRKTSLGEKLIDRFFVRKVVSGSKRTLPDSKRVNPSFTATSGRHLLLLADATATKNSVSFVRASSDPLGKGSNG